MTTNAEATLQHTVFHALINVHHEVGLPADNVQKLAAILVQAILAPHVRWATAQAAQEAGESGDIVMGRCRALAEDVADHGVRFDLNPTMIYHYDVPNIDTDTENAVSSEISRQYCDYLQRIDESIRERAAVALGRIHKEPTTMIAQYSPIRDR